MPVEFYRESPGKFDSRTLNRTTLNRWTGRSRAWERHIVRHIVDSVYIGMSMYTDIYIYICVYMYIYIYIYI